MGKNHVVIPADPNDEEDFDTTAEALGIAYRMQRERLARGGKTDPVEEMKHLHEKIKAMRSPEYKDATDEEVAAIINDLYNGLWCRS